MGGAFPKGKELSPGSGAEAGSDCADFKRGRQKGKNRMERVWREVGRRTIDGGD